MMREEFSRYVEEMGGKDTLTADQYKTVEFVYTYHPSISETNGKREIASIYVQYGYRVILDMVETAQRVKEIDDEFLSLRKIMTSLREKKDSIANGEIH